MSTGQMIFTIHAMFNNPLTIEMVHEILRDGEGCLADFREHGNYYLYNWERPMLYNLT